MSALTATQKSALAYVVRAVVDTVKEAGPLGAPGGVIYAALMTQGCTLQQYEGIMGGLVRCGALVREGECYRVRA